MEIGECVACGLRFERGTGPGYPIGECPVCWVVGVPPVGGSADVEDQDAPEDVSVLDSVEERVAGVEKKLRLHEGNILGCQTMIKGLLESHTNLEVKLESRLTEIQSGYYSDADLQRVIAEVLAEEEAAGRFTPETETGESAKPKMVVDDVGTPEDVSPERKQEMVDEMREAIRKTNNGVITLPISIPTSEAMALLDKALLEMQPYHWNVYSDDPNIAEVMAEDRSENPPRFSEDDVSFGDSPELNRASDLIGKVIKDLEGLKTDEPIIPEEMRGPIPPPGLPEFFDNSRLNIEEIEVIPRMIDAGEAANKAAALHGLGPKDTVIDIYRAMHAASPTVAWMGYDRTPGGDPEFKTVKPADLDINTLKTGDRVRRGDREGTVGSIQDNGFAWVSWDDSFGSSLHGLSTLQRETDT